MKYLRIIFAVILVCLTAGCGKSATQEDSVKDSLETFYRSINTRDYKMMQSVCTERMTPTVTFFRSLGKDLVQYRKCEVEDVQIKGDKAVAQVSCTDMYDNTVVTVWDLVLVNNRWLVNSYSNSDARPESAAEADSESETERVEATVNEDSPSHN